MKYRITYNDDTTTDVEADAMNLQSGSGMTVLTKDGANVAVLASGSYRTILPAPADPE